MTPRAPSITKHAFRNCAFSPRKTPLLLFLAETRLPTNGNDTAGRMDASIRGSVADRTVRPAPVLKINTIDVARARVLMRSKNGMGRALDWIEKMFKNSDKLVHICSHKIYCANPFLVWKFSSFEKFQRKLQAN